MSGRVVVVLSTNDGKSGWHGDTVDVEELGISKPPTNTNGQSQSVLYRNSHRESACHTVSVTVGPNLKTRQSVPVYR